jgi:hypothetical protein
MGRQHVFLSGDIIKQCEDCGRRMRSESIKSKLTDKHGFKGDPTMATVNHLSSECGAYAAGLVYDIPWVCRINTFKKVADLGQRTEVRTLGRLDYDLIVREDDPVMHAGRNAVYILVIGKWPDPWFWVCGSITGKKAKDRPLRPLNNDREWVYRIPQSELNPPPSYPF